MNILTITASDNGSGGASRVAMELHRAYQRLGHETHILAGQNSTRSDEVSVIPRPFWRKALSYALANDFDFFDGRSVLQSEAFRIADVVHCHNLNGWYFNLAVLPEMARQKPVVWTLHDMWALTPRSSHTDSDILHDGVYELSDPSLYPTTPWNNDRHLAKRKRYLLRDAPIHLVAPCQWLSDKIAPSHLGSKSRSVIYNGIDVEAFSYTGRDAARAELGVSDTPLALFVGSPDNQFKGYDDFRWLSQNLREAPLRFAMIGAEADGKDGTITQLKRSADKSRMSALMSAADIVVMPSRHEVFPLVMLEALSCGTPVVAYDVGGIGELLNNTPGSAIVPPRNRTALLDAVLASISRPEATRRSAAKQLRDTIATRFSLEAMAAEYLDLFIAMRSGKGHSTS